MVESLAVGPPWQAHLYVAQRAVTQANWPLFEQAAQALLFQFGNQTQALLDLVSLLLQSGQLSRAEALLHWCHQLEPTLQSPCSTWPTSGCKACARPRPLRFMSSLSSAPTC